jgi:glycosyltransferase involved in cell wall biosynthesis
MRISWFSAEPLADGALGVTGRIEAIRYLRSRGHDVSAVSGTEATSVPFDDIPSTSLPTLHVPGFAWLTQWPGVARHLARSRCVPDMIVSDFSLLPPVLLWRQRARRRTRVVLDVRTPPVEAGRARDRLQGLRFRATLRHAGSRVDAITATSVGLAEYVADVAHLVPERVVVWSSSGSRWGGTEMSTVPWPRELPTSLRSRILVLYHGSISPGRGLFEALRGFGAARSDGPELALVFLGAGPSVGALRRLTSDLGLTDCVWFVPSVPHHRVLEFLGAADVGLVPLPPRWKWEVSSPVKLAEYLCAGVPVVMTDIAPHRIVPRDSPFAFWCEDASPRSFEAAFRKVRTYGSLEAAGALARSWASERLSWEAQLEPLGQLVESLSKATDMQRLRL